MKISEENMEALVKQLNFLQTNLVLYNQKVSPYVLKKTVFKFVKMGIKIKIYNEQGHGNPHIHIDVKNKNHCASYSIVDTKLLAGKIDKKYEKLVLKWIQLNRNLLNEIWNEMQEGSDVENLILGLIVEV